MQLNQEWTYEKPKKAGFYMICHGDVVTEDNIEAVEIVEDKEDLILTDLYGGVYNINDVHKSYKFLYLCPIDLSK